MAEEKKPKSFAELLCGDPSENIKESLWAKLQATLVLHLFLDWCRNQPEPWQAYDGILLAWRTQTVDSVLQEKAEVDNALDIKGLPTDFFKTMLFKDMDKAYVKQIDALMSQLDGLAKMVLPERPREENHE